MIVYGTTMQERPDEVPEEVATWVRERNSRYPNIDFNINVFKPSEAEAEEFKALAQRYSLLFRLTAAHWGVSSVVFPYSHEHWDVRIVGGIDREGNIADRSKGPSHKGLPIELRSEIAGYSTEDVKISKELAGTPRKKGEAFHRKPATMVPLQADGRWVSEVQLSREEVASLYANPKTREELDKAIWHKDLDTIKRLKKSVKK